MSQEKGSVQVKIYGTEYPIKSEEDPDYIQKIAQYVDDRMHEISRGSTNSLPGVAILTAIAPVGSLQPHFGQLVALELHGF